MERETKQVTAQKVVQRRVLKYKYPRKCTEPTARKAFRQKVREKVRSMEREIAKLKGANKAAMREKLATYQEKHLTGA